MLRAVVFDVGDTLARRQFPNDAAYFYQVAVKAGLDVSPEQFNDAMARVMPRVAATIGPGARTVTDEVRTWQELAAGLVSVLDPDRPDRTLVRRIFSGIQAYPSAWELFPETGPVLMNLRARGLTLAVATNWEVSLPRFLRFHGIGEFFRVVLASAALGVKKPDPALFQAAAARLGLPPTECLYVGDDPDSDGDGAVQAGLRALVVRPRRTVPPWLTWGENLEAVPAYLDRLAGG